MSDTNVLTTLEAGGKVYCNLKSQCPFQFVDINGAPISDEVLPAVSLVIANQYKFIRSLSEVGQLQAAMSDQVVDLNAPKRYFELCNQMGSALKQRIKQLTANPGIHYIVVDTDVWSAAQRARGTIDAVPIEKLHMPLPYDLFHHRFYRAELGALTRADTMIEYMVLHPQRYIVERLRL